MLELPSGDASDANIYRILDSIGSSKESEIQKFRSLLSDEELKVYDTCVSLLKSETPSASDTKLKRAFRHMLDAIHGRTCTQALKDDALGDDFFDERRVETKKLEAMVNSVKKISKDAIVYSASISEKLNAQVKATEEDLAAQFSDVRESEGVDDYMHRIFLTTNEGLHEEVLIELQREPVIGNTFLDSHGGNTFIAVSGFCGLNIASVRGDESENPAKIDTIIILDRSLRVQNFWEKMKEIITSSNTRHEVIDKLEELIFSELFKVKGMPSHIKYDPLTDLRGEILAGNSWLSTTRRFNVIKQIFANKRFIFKRIDVTDLKSMQSLKEALLKNNRKVDTLYISNIPEYLKADQFESFKQGISELVEDKIFVVDTVPRKSVDEKLCQRVLKLTREKVDEAIIPPCICLLPK